MANNAQKKAEIIGHFLVLRQEVIRLYWQLLEIPTYQAPRFECTDRFCEALIDYTSMGHFHLYEQLFIQGLKPHKKSQLLYQKILDTTDVILSFNDVMEKQPDCLKSPKGKHLLSILGEALASRLELEDNLISLQPKMKTSFV